MRILIVGLARNLERIAASNISQLINAFQKYGDVSVFEVESESNDLTRVVLTRLAETSTQFSLSSLGNVIP